MLLPRLLFCFLASFYYTGAYGVSVRFACFGLGNEAKAFEVFCENREKLKIDVPRVGFSLPTKINSRTLYIDPMDLLPEGKESSQRQPLEVTLPETGGAFVVLLMGINPSGIQSLVLPSDSQSFKEGDLIFFNLSKNRVGIKLGDENVILDAYSKQVKRPPEMEPGESYQVQFFADNNGKSQLFSATRWQNQKDTRGYIFILQNPDSGRLYYKAMGEFVLETPTLSTQ